jgi:hypothetical protein
VPDADEVSGAELARREELARIVARNHAETGTALADLKSQLTTLFDRHVLTKVYEANERARDAREEAQTERIKRLEDNEASNRRLTRGAMLAGATTVITTILLHFMQKGGGS